MEMEGGRLSDTFLEEAWHTFSSSSEERSFCEYGPSLTSILECDEEPFEEEEEDGTTVEGNLGSERGKEQERTGAVNRIILDEETASNAPKVIHKLTLTRNLSTSTISSELKKHDKPTICKRRASMPVWRV